MSWPPSYVANATSRNPAPVLAELGLQNVTFHRPPLDPESGKRGCFLAHKFMIEQFMATTHPIALFFEDDIVLSPYRDEKACLAVLQDRERMLRSPTSTQMEWDMLLLGYGMNTSLNWKLDGRRVFPVKKFWATHAYALTQQGARKVHALLEWRGQDIDRQISELGAGVRIAALNPSVMYQSAGPSTILPARLSKAREVLFAHNNGITVHRLIEVCTASAMPVALSLMSVLVLLGVVVWLARRNRAKSCCSFG
jgi:hypothetical protein